MDFSAVKGLPYKPVRKLGNGSFGEVFLMEHIRAPNITAAVKVLEVDYCRKAEILEEFHLHKKLCRTVHQNIINLYWMHRTSDCIYFVMEDVDGGTLFDKFETNKIEPAAAQNYFKQLIAGLKYIHEELKICDFGAAMRYRYGAEEILLGSGVGSAEYTAPELYASLKCRGPPLDVWSAGVTLMLIVSGLQLWKYADIESPGYVDWIKGKTLSRKPWDEMDVSLIKLLRKVVTDKVDKRWTLERIEKCKWMKGGGRGRSRSRLNVGSKGKGGMRGNGVRGGLGVRGSMGGRGSTGSGIRGSSSYSGGVRTGAHGYKVQSKTSSFSDYGSSSFRSSHFGHSPNTQIRPGHPMVVLAAATPILYDNRNYYWSYGLARSETNVSNPTVICEYVFGEDDGELEHVTYSNGTQIKSIFFECSGRVNCCGMYCCHDFGQWWEM
ncbi:Protein CBG04705 [Caenorhabditis briggsae]|uniref:Protein CBG04705 n=1 Tax=Caenorhabditis briggsae TaxID=6238 RepID=A8WYA0_CAEBR|nr:Protein CBG04705 [Caenorhabditis briggsae]CAP25358.1 Protein CBG04705 [Caenorhabditis briggsae]